MLLLPLSSIADVPCYQAIQSQHDSIDSLETRLKTAQSLPYNQGYQEGYKQATLKQQDDYELKASIVLAIVIVVNGVLMFVKIKLFSDN